MLFNEVISSVSNDNQKLHIFFISQKITQHLSPAIGLSVFLRLMSFTSNPLSLNSEIKDGNKCKFINSPKGFLNNKGDVDIWI